MALARCKPALILLGLLAWSAALPAAADLAVDGDSPPASSWWSWWNGGGLFGLNIGGVSVGGAEHRVTGSDRLVHQLRGISGVRAIELAGPINLVIRQAGAEKATVHTDDNIAPLIETRVADGVLHIGVQPGASFRTRHPIGVTVELVRLGSLKLSGSGDASCDQLDTELLELTVSGSGSLRFDSLHASALALLLQGSGDVHLAGAVPKQGIVIEGSGSVDAEELAGRELAVRIAGSGDARVWVTDALAVAITGSGDVRYRGDPALTKSLHGSGSVTRQ
jgi:hypothetical protein